MFYFSSFFVPSFCFLSAQSEEGSRWIVVDGKNTQPNPQSSPVTPPAQRVQFILGQESQDVEHESHPVFSEMEELYVGEDGNMEWKETARW